MCVCLCGVRTVEVSLSDRRVYREVLLPNKMQVMLVHEKNCEEAAVSLRIGIGSVSDPRSLQGLAHLTEHMLFQGSVHHKGGYSFFNFIHIHGGQANAYTSKYSTVVSFSLSPQYLAAALERVSDILINPQFKPKDSRKEVHAVHAEYLLRYTSDDIRTAHLIRQVHPKLRV